MKCFYHKYVKHTALVKCNWHPQWTFDIEADHINNTAKINRDVAVHIIWSQSNDPVREFKDALINSPCWHGVHLDPTELFLN